jgi:hypothetical protein
MARFLQELVQPQHSKALDRDTTEQEGKLLVMRHENICGGGGASCVLQVPRSGAFISFFFGYNSVEERHREPDHDPDSWNLQFVETASLTLFGDTEGFNERERMRLSPVLKKLLEARYFASLSELLQRHSCLSARFLDALQKCSLLLMILLDGRIEFFKAGVTVDDTLRYQPYMICLPIPLKRSIGPLAVKGEVPDIVFQDFTAKSNEAIASRRD